jgi:hypothetical protein
MRREYSIHAIPYSNVRVVIGHMTLATMLPRATTFLAA